MGRDKVIIDEFLRGLNKHLATTFRITGRPDEVERQKQAVDTIARDEQGRTLAIEHTLIQPFVGEKDDAQRLLAAVAPLEADPTLRVPGKSIDVIVPVGAIPRRPDRKLVAEKVTAWFRAARLSFPEGQSAHTIPGLGFDLTLHVYEEDSPYSEGRVYVSRSNMPEDFNSVIGKALEDKLPKLAGTQADRRILLLEKDNLPRGYVEIGDFVESSKGEFPDLPKVDEVWVVNTVAWANEGCLFFCCVWPGGVTHKFRVGPD